MRNYMKVRFTEQIPSEIVLDKKELWDMIRSCGCPFSIGNSHCDGIGIFDEPPTICVDDYIFGSNPKFKYGKYWTIDYMWKLYIALRTMHSFTWKDIESIDPDTEVDFKLTVKARMQPKTNKGNED